ncbi:MAG: hypothetical protein K0S61_2960 [Anaerocolumna sp.]|jgi:hypothetical protein|nr:hypothetical protein [Anaerocolumna sp.]
MKITIGKKTYEQTKFKGRLTRKALEMQEILNGETFTTKEYDAIITFLADAFDNKFTSDDVLDELENLEIMQDFNYICEEVSKHMSGAVDEYEKK